MDFIQATLVFYAYGLDHGHIVCKHFIVEYDNLCTVLYVYISISQALLIIILMKVHDLNQDNQCKQVGY